jgi:FkbH-like protein
MEAFAHKAILISDFTMSVLAGYFNNDPVWPGIQTTVAPFGQVMQVLMDDGHDCWQTAPDIGVVWTRPQAVIEGFNKILQFEAVDLNDILEEVDAYCGALARLQRRLKWVFIPTWFLPSNQRGLGALDLRANGGFAHALMHMNLRLVQNLSSIPNYVVLDAQKWFARVGQRAFDSKLWYLGKIPFTNDVFKQAVRDVKAGLRALSGNARKLIILDLDDTLWSGTVGEVGWQELVLGGHDPIGEALVDFQRELKSLKNRGILLAVVSKNEESVALEAITKHPEMVLRLEDLVAWKINWQDKAANVMELVTELNLGLDSTVFIDDNAAERGRVSEALPQVFVPDWPKDKLLYRDALLALDCFDSGVISREDRARSNMYKTERDRTLLRSKAESVDKWLETLNTQLTIEPLSNENLVRITQLLNKTNQMNLATRRMTSPELVAWALREGRRVFAFRVSDRFGDSGLTGILSTEVHEKTLHIVDFILSCRVMGRHVEEAMLSLAVEYGRLRGLTHLCAQYIATEKNKPCLDFLLRCGLTQGPDDLFQCDLSRPWPTPTDIHVRNEIPSMHMTHSR